MVKIFIYRPLTEYALPDLALWSHLAAQDLLESIHDVSCKVAGLPTLNSCRDELCQSYFSEAQCPTKLHLLPPAYSISYSVHNAKTFPLPKIKTQRFQNSYVPYCLFNFNVSL